MKWVMVTYLIMLIQFALIIDYSSFDYVMGRTTYILEWSSSMLVESSAVKSLNDCSCPINMHKSICNMHHAYAKCRYTFCSNI